MKIIKKAFGKITKEQYIFLGRLLAYILIGLFVPAGYLVYKFKLFENWSKTSVSGWTLVAIIFVCVFILVLLNQVRKGMKFSIAKQVINVFYSITVPLALVAWVIWWMEDYINNLQVFFTILAISETVAGVINPLPQWANDNNVELQELSFKKAIDYFYKKKDDTK